MCDLQILLGFAYILPLLESMYVFIKFAQKKDVCVRPCGYYQGLPR
jgi:hypothetical protein